VTEAGKCERTSTYCEGDVLVADDSLVAGRDGDVEERRARVLVAEDERQREGVVLLYGVEVELLRDDARDGRADRIPYKDRAICRAVAIGDLEVALEEGEHGWRLLLLHWQLYRSPARRGAYDLCAGERHARSLEALGRVRVKREHV
jgi:hypothetical protein